MTMNSLTKFILYWIAIIGLVWATYELSLLKFFIVLASTFVMGYIEWVENSK